MAHFFITLAELELFDDYNVVLPISFTNVFQSKGRFQLTSLLFNRAIAK